jgi:transposase-like protein
MDRRARKFYSEEFKEHVPTAYYNSNESVSMVSQGFAVSRDTVGSWVYRKRTAGDSRKKVKLAPLETRFMKEKEMSAEEKDLRIRELEQALSTEKMRSESLAKMIEIAGRELRINIRKKLMPNSPRDEAGAKRLLHKCSLPAVRQEPAGIL